MAIGPIYGRMVSMLKVLFMLLLVGKTLANVPVDSMALESTLARLEPSERVELLLDRAEAVRRNDPRTAIVLAERARVIAHDLGHDGPPFKWDEDRRADLRADLDAFYARAYGLTRDELRYILDPADVKGPDYPSETFRVLKNNELPRLAMAKFPFAQLQHGVFYIEK